ncbi:MAG TPA: NADH-quinone oxidoreductase subunit NuoG [Burkholderiales bacterium]|nr:NADH-quinone oxidoreductase subunit NuoG [Burkholderiales bacterium]
MPKLTIDGRETEVRNGATVMEAANGLGIYIPHFCYHKKLSIAANCRMCLVQVEKAPKPMPACATPVSDGMKVSTRSDYARQAQDGVMEFLLINHPLDCPICDQGGECQLQDLAVGYGNSASRFTEEKRVVVNKNLGPLISTDMTRCIHCTRCVRYGQELAGVMELGMIGRGEHAEIISFVGKTVDSELSGNMIDLCPVGALTSKPFRYSARTWELSRRKSVSPHDSLGSNLVVQVKQNRVMRVLPLENDELNQCWLSDRDRFSYEGLNSEERLTKPMIKEDGHWREVDWQVALEHVARGLSETRFKYDPKEIGALASPHSTLEEMALLARLIRAMGGDNVDHRLRQSDFSADGKRSGAPWLGMKLAEIEQLDRVLLVGSFLRKDHPLLASRLRQIAKQKAQINVLHCADDDLLMPVANKAIVRPGDLVQTLAQVVRAVAEVKQKPVPPELGTVSVSGEAKSIAASLVSGKNAALFLGNLAAQHPQAAQLQLLAQHLADLLGCRFGFLGEAANSVGGYLAGCVPGEGGMNARSMLARPRRAYVLLHAEPDFDCHDPREATKAMAAADMVVALAAYRSFAADYADVLLPVVPYTETSGTYVNCEGRMQSFNAVVKPLGEARPAWKVLRVLGNLMSLPGFDHESTEAIRDEVCRPDAVAAKLANRVDGITLKLDSSAPAPDGLERIADVPIYFGDPIVRRAGSLQRTRDALPPRAWLGSALAGELGLKAGERVRVRQGEGTAVVEVGIDERLPAGCVRLAAAHRHTAGLGPMFGSVSLERA